jgi:hypothetical protein
MEIAAVRYTSAAVTGSSYRTSAAAPVGARLARVDVALTIGLGALIGLLTWNAGLVVPRMGIDTSWQVALQHASELGLRHGSEIVFSYGPLGLLEWPVVAFDSSAILAGLYAVVIRVILGATLIWAAARSFPLTIAALLALAVCALTPVAVAPLTIVLIWSLIALQDSGDRLRTLVLVGGGILSGLEFLVKLNLGLTLPLLVLIAALTLGGGRLRNVGVFLAAFVPTVIVLWFASGQTIGNLDDFVSAAAEVISGYSEAMAVESPYVSWDRAAAIAMIVAILGGTYVATRRLAPTPRLGTILIVAVAAFAIGKQGYVRHDFLHVDLFVGVIAAPWLALNWSGWARLAPAGAVAAILALSPQMTSFGLDQRVDPERTVDQLRAVFDPGRRAELRDQARAALAGEYDVSARMLALIGDRSVHVTPWETNLVWAYGLNWRPLPVFQDYVAYTAELDAMNADALADDDGPERILRHLGPDGGPAALDGRYAPFDAPATTRAMVCNFSDLATTAGYQLLGRIPDRCGPARELGSVVADYGEVVAVPRPPDRRSAVFARVEGNEVAGLERLRALIYRAASRRILLDGAEYRLIPQAASQGLLLSLPSAADFPAPFALAANPASVTLTAGTGPAAPDGPVRIEFFSVPLDPLPAAQRTRRDA